MKVVVTFAAFVTVALIVVPFTTSPISWLPEPGKAGTLLGILLTAQAAIVALTLAVTIFVMQGSRTREDIDDRIYHEYIRRSWVWAIFLGSVFSVGVTGLVFLIESLASSGTQVVVITPGLRNLTLVATVAFFANLSFVTFLFERAIRLAYPQQWRDIRLYVNKRDVREAVQAFLIRLRRVDAARNSGQLDFAIALPDSGEGSANEAIRALLDDGRRAITERRKEELTRSFDSIRQLVTYAMDELKGAGIKWGTPGLQPQWPPLRELESNLYSFREEALSRGDRDEVTELVKFDYWAVHYGMSQNCGELFTVGLAGYRWSYSIANQMGKSELLERLGEQFWRDARFMVFKSIPYEAYPYIKHMVNHQALLLHDAMKAERTTDYEGLHKAFEDFLRTTDSSWKRSHRAQPETKKLYKQLEQDYRIALMGLGGLTLLLSQSGSISDPNPYLDVARRKHVRVDDLANDITQVLAHRDISEVFQWSEWERKEGGYLEARFMFPEKYPLTWFSMRLIELATEPLHTLDLHGNARRVLDWFNANSAGLEANVREMPELTFKERREFATAALCDAVHKDEVAEDYETIGYDLSDEKVSAFKAEIYTASVAPNTIEHLFERTGTILDLASDAKDAPDERGMHTFEHKGFLAELPENARMHYGRLEGTEWGRSMSEDVMRQFCEALEEANQAMAPLNTPEEFVRAINQAITGLKPSGELIIVLSGDWGDFIDQLYANMPDVYEPIWQVPEGDRAGDLGIYRGHPIFQGPDSDDRIAYVVELQAWGRLVRAKIEESYHPFVKVNSISAERAQKHLEDNPGLFASEPDKASKLRKLQTHVEIIVRARRGFNVTDPTRACRIVGEEETGGTC